MVHKSINSRSLVSSHSSSEVSSISGQRSHSNIPLPTVNEPSILNGHLNSTMSFGQHTDSTTSLDFHVSHLNDILNHNRLISYTPSESDLGSGKEFKFIIPLF